MAIASLFGGGILLFTGELLRHLANGARWVFRIGTLTVFLFVPVNGLAAWPVIGTSAVGLLDIRATPLTGAMPGVEVHAQLIENILFTDHITRPYFADAVEFFTAVLLSLVQTCKHVGVDPFVYLRAVIERVSTHPMSRISELTPRQWRQLRQAPKPESAAA